MEHESYLHQEDRVSSLRCTCGEWKGRNLVDHEGHAEHVVAAAQADALDALAEGIDAYGPPTAHQVRGIAFMVRQGTTVRDWLAAARTDTTKEN